MELEGGVVGQDGVGSKAGRDEKGISRRAILREKKEKASVSLSRWRDGVEAAPDVRESASLPAVVSEEGLAGLCGSAACLRAWRRGSGRLLRR